MSERVDLARLLSFAADPKYKPGDDPLSDFTAVVMADAILAAGYVRLPVEGSPEEAAMAERMGQAIYDARLAATYRERGFAALRALRPGGGND